MYVTTKSAPFDQKAYNGVRQRKNLVSMCNGHLQLDPFDYAAMSDIRSIHQSKARFILKGQTCAVPEIRTYSVYVCM